MSNLRKIASSIVAACKSKGLKQSVVLDVLAKSQGFRSIQCAESAQSNTTDISLTEKIIIREVMARAYPGSDMLPLNLFTESALDTVEVGDTLFSWMWSLTNTGLLEVIKTLTILNAKIGFVGEMLCGEDFEGDKAAVLASAFPTEIIRFIEIEVKQGERNLSTILHTDLATSVYDVMQALITLAVEQGLLYNDGKPIVFMDGYCVIVMNDAGLNCASFTPYGYEMHNGKQFIFGDNITGAAGRWYVCLTDNSDWIEFKTHIADHLGVKLGNDVGSVMEKHYSS